MKHIISRVGQTLALQAFALIGLLVITTNVLAEMPIQPKSMWNETVDDATITKDARRDPNTYCVSCHGHLSKFEHKGKHFEKDTVSPNNGKALTCVSCHGNISENHRKGVKDVMRFNAYGKAKRADLERSPQEQNQVCFACHNPDKLREAFWPHDTHANKMACVNCHKIHPENEPMRNTDSKQRVKLCVDCHSRIHENRNQKSLKSAKENQ
ncbi:respiratory nitrite reductase-specific menaquinol--cytochrome-c reductase complex subunit NrfB precursor [Bisgaardia hudsonensis]|uniref:Respiratory nitrite reductase-specific menaquinol--cytochrome-c reductase complex subunit NrfB n=1 Tax=Bisgaardia hudsonensis TaxID=109472 RepID=A0A4R2N0G1_9PAST|nr:cytochrome c nitrite reductase pentaheme subunit [Bisgaardia hudsonensis]QLB13473.1 cytochrome c nitrite reductase pentaheme subunit [Bisgaardia hudsonensis]TCP12882.1 respiratory nitrite reductase-specific menaquinol--cytochrome-c reductase complex subunit NrfB precursor [Bisgaardia hudsonensis]